MSQKILAYDTVGRRFDCCRNEGRIAISYSEGITEMKISVCISQRINNPDQTELEGCEGFKLPFHDDAVQDHALTKFRTDKNGGFVWVGAGYRVQEIPV